MTAFSITISWLWYSFYSPFCTTDRLKKKTKTCLANYRSFKSTTSDRDNNVSFNCFKSHSTTYPSERPERKASEIHQLSKPLQQQTSCRKLSNSKLKKMNGQYSSDSCTIWFRLRRSTRPFLVCPKPLASRSNMFKCRAWARINFEVRNFPKSTDCFKSFVPFFPSLAGRRRFL